METDQQKLKTVNKHMVLSVYSKHIIGPHLQLKRDLEKLCILKNEFKTEPDTTHQDLVSIARKRNCNQIVLYETKDRGKLLYMYIANCPNGPTVKIQIDDILDSKNIRFDGNFATNSRHVLIFDKKLKETIQNQILVQSLTQVLQIPDNHYAKVPFIDHAIVISQLKEDTYQFDVINKDNKLCGPQFKFQLCTIYSGCFSGNEIYRNIKQMKQLDGKREQEKKYKENKWLEGTWDREVREKDEVNSLFYQL